MMNRKGFSLLELLIAISVVSLLIGIGISNYRDFQYRQKVDDMSRKLISSLRAIQQDAASGAKKPSTLCTGPLSGYQIFFNVNAVSYNTGTKSNGYTVSSLCPTTSNLVETVTFPSDQFIIINRTPANAKFLFKTLQSGTDIPVNNPFIFAAGSDNTDRTITITVDSTGTIQ